MNIVPHNWKDFQHADTTKRGHAPKWIKNHTALMSNDDYLGLSAHLRGILHGIWLEYALGGGKLRLDRKLISTRLGVAVKMRDLEALNQAGFLDFCQDDGVTASSLDVEEIRQDKVIKANRTELRVAFSADKERELGKILELADGADGNSFKVLREIAQQLPLGSIAKVRESIEIRRRTGVRVGVGYAVEALRSEVGERMSA